MAFTASSLDRVEPLKHYGPSQTADRVVVLDILRGVAALCVVLMHGRSLFWVGLGPYADAHPLDVSFSSLLAYALAPLTFGAIGVSLLFVLSGYVIHRGSARLLGEGQGGFDTWSFYKRRFLRIYPTLLLALVVTVVCDSISRHYVPSSFFGDTSFWGLISSGLALQGIVTDPYGSNTPLWSLAIEIQFYLVYPFALLIRGRVGMDVMMALAIVFSLLGAILLHSQGITAFPQFYVAWWAGAYIADREAARRPLPQNWPWFAAAFVVMGCVTYAIKLCSLGIVLWAIGLAPVLAYLVQKDFRRIPAAPMLTGLGRFSYTLYAVHFPLLVLASAVLFSGAKQTSIVWTLALTAVTVVACYGAYLLVERPSVRMLEAMRR